MSNDYSDLTDMISELIENYSDEGIIIDLDAWSTDDLLLMRTAFDQAIELRVDDNELERMRDIAAREMEEDELLPLTEYFEIEEEPIDEAENLEAEYDDPLFIG